MFTEHGFDRTQCVLALDHASPSLTVSLLPNTHLGMAGSVPCSMDRTVPP